MTKAWHQNFKKSHKLLRTSIDGEVHDSKSEMGRWEALKAREKSGEIRGLRRQVSFPLARGDIKVFTRAGAVYKYKADFVYDEKVDDDWVPIVEEHKGYFDRTAKLKIAVFEALYGVKVRITGLR